ncbi:hypothetical protein [Methanolobus psychrotolerans]|uniref:hypothetical protein n=1 Tax=Methanolobus psychrotolerans TaxID=1874706 RepID=UPI001F5D6F06|nr:hypothetical protein [Methanolobus psychrotolerans]
MSFLAGDANHLARLFPKPEEGEVVLIHFIDMQDKLAGWSPELKRSVYVDDFKDTEKLKRVREVTLLTVYNWILDGESLIELSDMEKIQFEEVMNMFIKHGGEILFTRKRIDGRFVNYFILDDNIKSRQNITTKSLAEMLGH